MLELSADDIHHLLTGSAILGTGGGGSIEEGMEYVDEISRQGKTVRLASLDELADEQFVYTPYLLGALQPSDGSSADEYATLPRSTRHPIMLAFDEMQSRHEQALYGAIACELGGANSAVAAFVAAMSNGVMIDADLAGRAVPEVTHSTYYLHELDAAPIALANEFGERFLCEYVHDDQRAERIVRALAQVSRNDIAVVDHAIPAAIARPAVIHGSMSRAIAMGRSYKQAVASGTDKADAIALSGGGKVVFRGAISAAHFSDSDGFTQGKIELEGAGEHSGSSYRIGVKNENLVSWLNDTVHVTIPELIVLVDLDAKQPLCNPGARVGMRCAVVVLPAEPQFLTDKALRVFGPAYAGVDAAFEPLLAPRPLQDN